MTRFHRILSLIIALLVLSTTLGVYVPEKACAWSLVDAIQWVNDNLRDPGCWNNAVWQLIKAWLDGKISLMDLIAQLSMLYQQYMQDRVLAGDPVDVVSGAYIYRYKDFNIPAPGPGLTFERYYHSRDGYDGPFGAGWNHSLNISVFEVSDGTDTYLICHRGNGDRYVYTETAGGSYTNPTGIFDTVTKNATGVVITRKDGTVEQYNSNGFIQSITDKNKNTLTFSYESGSGVLKTVTDTLGRQLTFEYNNDNKISKITDYTGRYWQYAYTNTVLTAVTTPATAEYTSGVKTSYNYSNNLLVAIRDPNNNDYISITYDTQNRVTEMTYGGEKFSFSYGSNMTTFYDRKGSQTDYYYNSNYLVTEIDRYKNGSKYKTKMEYNSNKQVTKLTYPNGGYLTLDHDSKGNITKMTKYPKTGVSATPLNVTASYETTFNKIKTYTDARGNSVAMTYDYELSTTDPDYNTKGNIVKITYPSIGGKAIEYKYSYNNYGQVTRIVNPQGIETSYEYYGAGTSSPGYLKKITYDQTGINAVNEFGVNSVGKITSVTDGRGNKLEFTVDQLGRITKIKNALGTETQIKYDANGNLVQLDRQTGNTGDPYQTTKVSYDMLDRIKQIENELGDITGFSYDANGNLYSLTDAESNSTGYSWNALNQLDSVTDAESNNTYYSYDVNGNLTQIEDAKANKTTYEYDGFDRISKITYPDASSQSVTYDNNSNILSYTTRKADTITYTYDALNRLTKKTYPDTTTEEFTYDELSRITKVTRGTDTIDYTYDNLNRIATTTTNSKTISYEYDKNNNLTKLTYPDNLEILTYEYDKLNRLTKITGNTSTVIAEYTYDNLNTRQTLKYANGETISYDYDALSQLEQVKSTLNTIDYTLDKVGNRQTMTNNSGQHDYTYDNIYQLTKKEYPVSSQDETFDYDYTGNRKTGYTANSLNQYSQVGTTTYTYDNNGNLTSDGTNTYTYDYTNKLTSATKTGTTASYKYDPFGRRTQKTINSTTTNYLYSGAHILVEYDSSFKPLRHYIYGPGIDEPVRMTVHNGASKTDYYYHADGLGSITHITDSSGTRVESYEYTAFGIPTIRNASNNVITTSSVGNPYFFTGRRYDPETGLYYYRLRYYSPTLGRFLQTDSLGYWDGMNLYQYCNNNPINWIDPFGLCKKDGEDRSLWDKWSDWWDEHTARGYSWSLLGSGEYISGTEMRDTKSFTAVGFSLDYSIGDIPGPGDHTGDINIGIGKHLGITLQSFGYDAEKRNITIHVGLGLGFPGPGGTGQDKNIMNHPRTKLPLDGSRELEYRD